MLRPIRSGGSVEIRTLVELVLEMKVAPRPPVVAAAAPFS
jgi:hypothetical protein